MSIAEIEKFLSKQESATEKYTKINFKKRDPVYGLFIKANDYGDLKSKNFWRIVTQTHFDKWNGTKDVSLAKIYSGFEFSKLTLYKDSFD